MAGVFPLLLLLLLLLLMLLLLLLLPWRQFVAARTSTPRVFGVQAVAPGKIQGSFLVQFRHPLGFVGGQVVQQHTPHGGP